LVVSSRGSTAIGYYDNGGKVLIFGSNLTGATTGFLQVTTAGGTATSPKVSR